VRRHGAHYVMNFPRRELKPVALPAALETALGTRVAEAVWDGFNLLARLESATAVRQLTPDIAAIAQLPSAGVVVTATGDGGYDFISRYFAPAKGIPEDPVTGGAYWALAPFWAARLGQTEFRAFQASRRGGELICRLVGERVELEGACVFYLEGEVTF